jgi:phage-related protein
MKRSVIFYRKENGNCPVEKYLDSLSSKAAQKITWILNLIEDLDFIPKQYYKKLKGTDDIWECRIRFGSDYHRILCFIYRNNLVVLTHGFIKKTNIVPKKEIKKAENYKKDFLKRRNTR